MKLRDIIKLSAIMLNLDEILNSTKLYDNTFDITDENTVLSGEDDLSKTFNLLIRCFNLVYSEIATDYVQIIDSEVIEVKNETFDLSKLKNKFYKLIKLEDEKGCNIKCSILGNNLKVNSGTYKIIYCYIPKFVTLNDDLEDFGGQITERLFAYGLNKEYLYVSSLFEEAESYKTKFEEGLKAICSKKNNIVIPVKRRWI